VEKIANSVTEVVDLNLNDRKLRLSRKVICWVSRWIALLWMT